ncbi:MAG: zf-TFIIB domain-containing protein [Polyangiaceae bacterium]|nr:zf-TFIIB domain-containing protein [Polyangiaceae bacterium]
MVDVCAECEGAWLDVEELEQLEDFFASPIS